MAVKTVALTEGEVPQCRCSSSLHCLRLPEYQQKAAQCQQAKHVLLLVLQLLPVARGHPSISSRQSGATKGALPAAGAWEASDHGGAGAPTTDR